LREASASEPLMTCRKRIRIGRGSTPFGHCRVRCPWKRYSQPSVWVLERPMPPNMNLWGHRSFGRPDHPSTGVDVDPAAGGDVEATPLPRQPTFGSPDSRKEPPESAKRNKTRGEISRKYGVNCSRSVADPRSGANKPRILEPVRTILKKSEGCLRHKFCCPDQTWSTGKR
jgi:hypothetical protein